MQIVPGIPTLARKSPKAARTAGRRDQPGAISGAGLLSCSIFEPSALPLPQVSSRGRLRQRLALPRPENVIGRLTVFCPASRRFLLYCPQHRRASVPLHSGEQRPQHRVSLPRRSTDTTRPAGGAQTALQGGDMGFPVCVGGQLSLHATPYGYSRHSFVYCGTNFAQLHRPISTKAFSFAMICAKLVKKEF